MDEKQTRVSLKKVTSQSWTDPATGEIYPGGNPNAAPQPTQSSFNQPFPQQVQQSNFAQNVSVVPSSNIEVYPNANIPQKLQPGMKYCKFCGQQIPMEAVLCVKCGRQVEQLQGAQNITPQVVINNTQQAPVIVRGGTPKNKWVAFVLAFFIGYLGAHRFYEGKIGTGLLWFFTGGLFGIGWLVDWITILTKPNPYYV